VFEEGESAGQLKNWRTGRGMLEECGHSVSAYEGPVEDTKWGTDLFPGSISRSVTVARIKKGKSIKKLVANRAYD
jgi:hypothetical protein